VACGTPRRYDAGVRLNFFITDKANRDYIVTGVADIEEDIITHYLPAELFMPRGLTPDEEQNMAFGLKPGGDLIQPVLGFRLISWSNEGVFEPMVKLLKSLTTQFSRPVLSLRLRACTYLFVCNFWISC
jgi:hypothetical protein